MKTAIIYTSQTGFTKKYADWLKEALGEDASLFTLDEAKKAAPDTWNSFDVLVYGGWMCAGSIKGVTWFKKNIAAWNVAGKKLAVYATGASPAGDADIAAAFDRLLSEAERRFCPLFYCPGGKAFEKLPRGQQIIQNMFARMLASQAKKDPSLAEKAAAVTKSYDATDRKYIEPVLAYLKD